jgi:hypothetical protein
MPTIAKPAPKRTEPIKSLCLFANAVHEEGFKKCILPKGS